MKEEQCQFLKSELVQGIRHEFCNNPAIRCKNKVPEDKKLPCISSTRCGIARCISEDAGDINKTL